jgi:hypothetical protein
MAIANALQKGLTIYVYDECGRTLFTKILGSQPADGLQGYTSSTVSIKLGLMICTYDEKGRPLHTQLAR